VYATCSLLQEENDNIADAFIALHPQFTLVPANTILAQQQIALDTGPYLKLLPHLHQTDGFFAAVFEKEKAPAKLAPAVEAIEEPLAGAELLESPVDEVASDVTTASDSKQA